MTRIVPNKESIGQSLFDNNLTKMVRLKHPKLLYVTTEMHKLIHATTQQTINKYMEYLRPNKRVLGTINKYRKLSGNYVIN